MTFDFSDIRPFFDNEVPDAIQRIHTSPELIAAVKWVFPELSTEQVIEKIKGISTIKEFQLELMHIGIRKIVSETSKGLTFSGFETLNPNNANLFIANHRDIFLDSALLQILLVEHSLNTTQITFGSNLMQGVFVDIGKVNKMFTVYRGGNRREVYQNSLKLSSYIRETINSKKESIWIAQRAGRTKDGNDITQTGVPKMFSQSGSKDFVANFEELNITPISTSYELEPCDFLKTKELYLTKKEGEYTKSKAEDIQSILQGIIQPKGRIHMAVTPAITKEELIKIDNIGVNFNDKIKHLTELVNSRIYSHYKLWPTNYLAVDILSNSTKYSTKYTEEDKKNFEDYLNNKLTEHEGERALLKQMLLEMYAYPVHNFESIANVPLPV